MRICAVSPLPPRFLGLGNYLSALLSPLAGLPDIDELIVLGDITHNSPFDHVLGPVKVTRCWHPDSPAVLRQIVDAVRAEAPDLVWFNTGFILGRSPVANMLRACAPALARAVGFPSVVTLHHVLEAEPLQLLGIRASPLQRLGGRVATRMLLRANRVCLTLGLYVRLMAHTYAASNLVHIPHHTFSDDIAKLSPKHSADDNRSGLRLLAFGVMAPYKGLDALLHAHTKLREAMPQTELRIAGAEHPRFPGLSATFSARNAKNVKWCGEVSASEIDRLMSWADVVVVPNLAATGSSSVIHRAAAHGKAIVASDLSEYRALAEEEGIRIEFVPPGNVEALARAVRGCSSRAARRESGRANIAAAARLTPSRVAERYGAVFRGALAEALESSPVAVPAELLQLPL